MSIATVAHILDSAKTLEAMVRKIRNDEHHAELVAYYEAHPIFTAEEEQAIRDSYTPAMFDGAKHPAPVFPQVSEDADFMKAYYGDY